MFTVFKLIRTVNATPLRIFSLAPRLSSPHVANFSSFGDFHSNLQKLDWSKVELPEIKKNLYNEHPNVANKSPEDVAKFRDQYNIMVNGTDPPNPIIDFEEGIFPEDLMKKIREYGYDQPTSIQAQSWPIALQGRDLVGIAQTGTGKTLAYILPALMHIRHQPRLNRGDGPIVLVLAPTRELTQQIHEVTRKFAAGIHVACLFGGSSRIPQITQIQKGAHICIATPGRLIDLLDSNVFNLQRCSYLVLDEADRMLDMGFEPQIRAILGQTREDRQTLMWSATWPREIQQLAEDFLKDYVQINIGSTDQLRANHNITQHVQVCEEYEKKQLLLDLLEKHKGEKILIFAQTKKRVDYITSFLAKYRAKGIHGDRSQRQRDQAIFDFKRGFTKVLVATDVASRGLDVKDINVVINNDFPQVAEDYIHRIGRTGRVEKSGISYTFFTKENAHLARDLIKIMEEAGQEVPPSLASLVEQNYSSHQRGGFRQHGGRPNYSRNFSGPRRPNFQNRPYQRHNSSRSLYNEEDNFGDLEQYK